eukprot:TRINITY_DN1784_c0_g1_i1.p1 TRINITY_DN1784_c0_g1~~TRINITY_DN1784_c0_g1_i1.p1  ORF type:complete len:680 (-),score=236.76 TRINITY_DN1784_c0_g1_i1:45-2084(-)
MDLKRARDTSHKKEHSFIFIHNQSNTGGDLDPSTQKIPLGQAGDANAMCLGNQHDIVVTTLPIDPAYLHYWTSVLHLTVPQIFTPKKFTTDLVQSVVDCQDELVKFVKDKQKEGIVNEDLILSVFEADDRDIALLSTLQKAGLENLTSECNYELLSLGNKDGFRSFCKQNKITQLPGDNFKTIEEVEHFVDQQHKASQTVVIKSPHGIGGGGQIRLRPPHPDTSSTTSSTSSTTWQDEVKEWLKKEKAVAAEQFAEAPERELVVDIYIDPTDAQHTAVVFDQLVKNDNSTSGMSYYGAKYPSTAKRPSQKILAQVESTVAPSLQSAGYRGPAGIDVLWNPLHFMELNMRTDAITYVKHLSDRVGKNLYKTEPGKTAFMSLVNLPLPPSKTLETIMKENSSAITMKDDGIFVFSNPNRQRWGFFDVVAISPLNLSSAEQVMKRGLTEIWGEEQATAFLKAMYVPHPQIIPEVGGEMPYLVTIPKQYYDDVTKTWPVILFLHGMDERGEDLSAIKEHGIPKVTMKDEEFGFIGICPQLPADKEVWDVAPLTQILDQVTEEFRVDKSRQYLTGMSMGGHGVWAMALADPSRYAAIAPICGDAHEDTHLMPSLKDLPVWAFHGTNDPIVPFKDTVAMVDHLVATGNTSVKFTKYQGGEHDAWTETYDNPALYKWFLEHKRKDN